jgi:predicted helicase
LAENQQKELFAPANTQRVRQQQQTELFVILGNPPYNAWQTNENDNNKNRQYPTVDNWIRDSYAKDSHATNKNALYDPYVKAIKWAAKRITHEGIVAFVTNNSFLDSIVFDGMRKHLAQEFSKIYILDLGGNVRKNPKLSGTTHNVFGIQVGVSINLFIKKRSKGITQIFYASLEETWRKEEKYRFLEQQRHNFNLAWQLVKPNQQFTWLTEGLHSEFEQFIPLGTKEAKVQKCFAEGVIFKTYSNGVETNRDVWVYNFQPAALTANIKQLIAVYHSESERWQKNRDQTVKLDDFVSNDESQIKWCSRLKECLLRGKKVSLRRSKIRRSSYRPFCEQYLFFDAILIHRQGQFPRIFPTLATEAENRVICCTNHSQIPFVVQITNCIPDLCVGGRNGQCFPFYTYDEDGSNRTENITDWALNHWQQHYQDRNITKWAIFYYVYALLHHPHYREKYAQNLKRELPRLPLASEFWVFAKLGEQLAELHLNYEQVEPYPLQALESTKYPFSLLVEKMRLNSEKTQLIYNNFLTLNGIPPATFDYKLGNRSALEWIIEQYRLTTDKRSGIINNPNRPENEYYIIELVKKIVTVSLTTQQLVEKLRPLAVS